MEEKERSKQIFGSVVLVVGVVILVAISGLIVGSVLGQSVFTDTTTTGTNTNESLGQVDNVTTINFAILGTFPDATCTLTSVVNATGGESITSSNYTQPTTCQILATSGAAYLNESWNVSYSYSNTESSTASINVTELTNGFSAFALGLLTFLGIIGVIIGIVWLVSYLRPLFSKKEGIQSFSGN